VTGYPRTRGGRPTCCRLGTAARIGRGRSYAFCDRDAPALHAVIARPRGRRIDRSTGTSARTDTDHRGRHQPGPWAHIRCACQAPECGG
jgi:hypothetical protein